MLKLCAAALAAACLVTPAVAADCSGQLQHLKTLLAKQHETVLADIKLATMPPIDRELIVGYADGAQSIWFFAKGCLFEKPLVLAPIPDAPPPDPPAVPAPAPKPSGLELGA